MKEKAFLKKFRITANKNIRGNYFKISFIASEIASSSQPGQFLMVKPNSSQEPLLRRPLGIHSVKKDKIEILYEVVGKGTEILSHRKPGEYLDVIGPLGNGFDLRAMPVRQSISGGTYGLQPILVAGGMGVAPLIFLAERLHNRKPKTENRKPLVLIGAKTKKQLLSEKEFKDLGYEVKVSTDDGSKGFKGKVTALLNRLLSTMNYELSTIYACGPTVMLESVSNIASKYGIAAFGSFEAHLACGIGACMGCAIRTKDEGRRMKDDFRYKRVCKDGPVFALNQISWGRG